MSRAIAVVVLVIGLVAGVGPAAASEPSAAVREITRAYTRVFDRSLPLRERITYLEDGVALRPTLRELDDLETISGFDIDSTGIEVYSVRVHRGDAEVSAGLAANGTAVTGWPGVAHRIGGRWLVARDTVCTILLEWTPVRCPGSPTRTEWLTKEVAARDVDGEHRIAITFPDGASADLVVPQEMSAGWAVHPRTELLLDGGSAITVWFQPGWVPAQQPVRSYPGPPGEPRVEYDARSGLVIDLDGWTAFASRAYRFDDRGDEVLSEQERALVARHLTGHTSDAGFPVLTPTAPVRFPHGEAEDAGVRLAKSALAVDASRSPIELSWSDGDAIYVMVVLTAGPCWTQPPQRYEGYAAIEQCTDDGFGRIAVEGNPLVVEWLLDVLRVEDYAPRPATVSV